MTATAVAVVVVVVSSSTVTKIELRRREGSEAIHTARGGRSQGGCGFRIATAILEMTEVTKSAREKQRDRNGGSERVRCREVRQKARAFGGSGDHLTWSAIAATERSASPFDMRTGL